MLCQCGLIIQFRVSQVCFKDILYIYIYSKNLILLVKYRLTGKHSRVFLLPCKKSLVQCTLLYTSTLDKSLIARCQKTRPWLTGHTAHKERPEIRGLSQILVFTVLNVVCFLFPSLDYRYPTSLFYSPTRFHQGLREKKVIIVDVVVVYQLSISNVMVIEDIEAPL